MQAARHLRFPTTKWEQLVLQKLQPSTIATYSSALFTLSRYCTPTHSSFFSAIAHALAEYSTAVLPSRLWTAISALTWAKRLSLLPPFDLLVCQAIGRGVEAAQPPILRQLWFHPTDMPVLSRIDADFECAAHLSFDLMLRSGQLDRLCCGDLDYATCSVWCPPHKNVQFPYLRQPKPAVWSQLVQLHNKRPAGDKLFKRTARQYSQMLGDLTQTALQVRFTWHSLRRGGATTRAHLGQSADAIRRFGCWGSERAITHYIFPWSEVPLRHWRADSADTAPTGAASQPAAKPHPKRSRRAPKATADHGSRRRNDRPIVRSLAKTTSS